MLTKKLPFHISTITAMYLTQPHLPYREIDLRKTLSSFQELYCMFQLSIAPKARSRPQNRQLLRIVSRSLLQLERRTARARENWFPKTSGLFIFVFYFCRRSCWRELCRINRVRARRPHFPLRYTNAHGTVAQLQ